MSIEKIALAAAKSTYVETSLLNPAFVYVPASKTNIAETFARIRTQQADRTNVTQIKKKAAKC